MFCSQFRPLIGGAERQVEKLAQALTVLGCRVLIVTPRIDADSPAIEECGGVRIERFQLTDLSRRFSIPGIALLNIPFILWQVARAVLARINGYDLLHCHIASLQIAGAALAAHLVHVPVLCKAAMADQRSDLGEIEKTGASGRLVSWLVRKLITNWIATTQAVKHALVRAGVNPKQITLIPNGVDLPAIPAQPAHGLVVKRFLYLGRLSTNSRRDVPTLIQAFDLLAAQHTAVELALVGDGDLLEETRVLVAASAAHARIFVPGFEQPEPWLAWADCFVLPSRVEGLSNALLEAMAAGLPCIANDIPPNREVLDDGVAGVLVPVGDVDGLFEAMRKMATDAVHADVSRRAALQRATEQYGIHSVALRCMALYDHLIQENNE